MNYSGHIAFGLEVYKKIHKYIKDKDVFITGCVAPDIAIPDTITKGIGHFREDSEYYFLAPDLDKFLAKYKNRLNEDFVLGYFCHLYADVVFSKYYMPSIATPLDKDYNRFNSRKAKYIYLSKNQNIMDAKLYAKMNPIYQDYTISDSHLIKEFNLPLDFNFSLEDPKIDEIDPSKLSKIKTEVKVYFSNAVIDEETMIMDIQGYCDTIRKYSDVFVDYYLNNVAKK